MANQNQTRIRYKIVYVAKEGKLKRSPKQQGWKKQQCDFEHIWHCF